MVKGAPKRMRMVKSSGGERERVRVRERRAGWFGVLAWILRWRGERTYDDTRDEGVVWRVLFGGRSFAELVWAWAFDFVVSRGFIVGVMVQAVPGG